MKYPHAIITEQSRYWFDRGLKILEGNRLGETDEDHVKVRMHHMGLNGEKRVADMGCGFGEVSRLIADKFRDTVFYLVNQNEFQLSKCPKGFWFEQRLEDMCNTSIPDRSIDLVMFNYSLCHVDPVEALREAHRIATESGRLFVYDYERIGGDNSLTEQYLFADFVSNADFRSMCKATKWRDVETIHPGGDDKIFRTLLPDSSFYDLMFDDLKPVIWKAKA
jgi:ubiquinone/menaquinone biosynthesis C-methylase UbiE